MAEDYLSQIRTSAQQTLAETRLLIFELRPQILEKRGLAAALKARLEAVEGRSKVEVKSHLEEVSHLTDQVETNLYRIALEALNNSLLHSKASRVRVTLSNHKSGLILEVTDDGIGFDPKMQDEQGGVGLKGMRERAKQIGAELSIVSEVGQGAHIKVEVPL